MTLRPPSARETSVRTRAGQVHVLRAGDDARGLPVVLLHGGGYDRAAISWFHLIPELSRDRPVIAVDLPGFGGSIDTPPVGGPGPMADVVVEVMDLLGIPTAVVIGCSMGGDVALTLAIRRPDRVAGLVLVGPGGLAPLVRTRLVHTMAWLGTRVPDPVLRPLTRLANRWARKSIDGFVHDRAAVDERVLDAFVAEAGHPLAGLAFARYNQATIGPARMRNDRTAAVGSIAVPTLFFHGAEDTMVSPDDSRRAAARMPDARLVVVEGCGHWAQHERREAFHAEVRRFLRELEGR